MASVLKYGNFGLKFFTGTEFVRLGYIAAEPSLPADTDFVYLAKNFDGTKIVNAAQGSTFGDYLQWGTLTVNGSGASCYLSNGLDISNYLYKQLTDGELDNIKAVSGTYTFFIRMMQTGTYSGTCGGIMSTRAGGNGYNYMIRCENNQLQFHTETGTNLGSDFMLNVDRVYKITVSGSIAEAKNLDTGVTWTSSIGTSRLMTHTMTTFWAGFILGESSLDRFYGFAGIARATTAAEDDAFKTALMTQET